jgi:hypothetical protein
LRFCPSDGEALRAVRDALGGTELKFSSSLISVFGGGPTNGEALRTPTGNGDGEALRTPTSNGDGEALRTPTGNGDGEALRTPTGNGDGEALRTPTGNGDGESLRAIDASLSTAGRSALVAVELTLSSGV